MSTHLPPIDKKKKKKSRSKSKSKSKKHKDETVNTTTIIKTLNEFNVSRVEKDHDTTMNENKAKLGVHAFVVDKNIHDNYSAYRLNNNMGIGGGHGPSKKRMGFNGQFVDMDEYNYMKYNGMLNPDLNQSNQVDGSYMDSFQGNQLQTQPSQQQQYSYPAYNPSTNYNQVYYENAQNPSVSQSMPYFSQPMYNSYAQPQYNVHNRYNSYNPSAYAYQNRVPMLNFNSPSYQGNMGTFPDISTGRVPRSQQLPSISQSNPRMTRYASANRANFGFNQPPANESWERQKSLGRNYQMKNPSMY